MKKVELLSPAGNFDCLIAAVQAGADAVYLGATDKQKFRYYPRVYNSHLSLQS